MHGEYHKSNHKLVQKWVASVSWHRLWAKQETVQLRATCVSRPTSAIGLRCNWPSDGNWLQATVSAHGARNCLKLKTQTVCVGTLCRWVSPSRGSEGSQCPHLQQAVPEDDEAISTFRNVANQSPNVTAPHHRRHETSAAPLWEPQMSPDLRQSQRWLGTWCFSGPEYVQTASVT